jgi:hypothetical protein
MTPEYYQKCKASVTYEFSSMDLVARYSFVVGCFLKYMLRYKYKGHPAEDLLKAKDYFELMKTKDTGYLRPIHPIVGCKDHALIDAFQDNYSWLKLVLDPDGNIYLNPKILDYIDSELAQYTPEQTDSNES